MDEKQRYENGLELRRRMLGEAHVERSLARAAGDTGANEFQELLTRYAWGEIWTRPGIDLATRRILVLGTLVALGRFEEFELHARAALAQGDLEPYQLHEVVLQQAIYCGIPAANRAFEVLRSIERGAVES